MSSTVRVYVNEKRIATGKVWKGQFLQVYPEKKTFASEADWRTAIYESLIPTIKFVTTETKKVPSNVDSKPQPPPEKSSNPKEKEKPTEKQPISKNHKDWKFVRTKRVVLPPGEYYIGDLCYALDDKLYDTVFGSEYENGFYCLKDSPADAFWLWGTGGDGLFRGTDDFEYGVDAGILGIAAASTLDPQKAPFEGGRKVSFKGNVTASFHNDKFYFESDNYSDQNVTISLYSDDSDISEW